MSKRSSEESAARQGARRNVVGIFPGSEQTGPPQKYHRVSYVIPAKRDSSAPRKQLPPCLRDSDAAQELTTIMHRQGYEYGELVINYPGDPTNKPSHPDGSKYGRSDRLLVTTRLPINDPE